MPGPVLSQAQLAAMKAQNEEARRKRWITWAVIAAAVYFFVFKKK